MAAITEEEIEQLENDCKVLKPMVDKAEIDLMKIHTVRDQRKKELKEKLQLCNTLGVDPENIEEEVRKLFEIARIKKDNCQADVKSLNVILAPLLKELE